MLRTLLLLLLLSPPALAVTFSVQFDKSLRSTPATGRLVVYLLKSDAQPLGATVPADGPFVSDPQPLYGISVKNLLPESTVVIDDSCDCFPVKLSDVPKGDYKAQAVLDLHREHVRWEQEPGNLYSEPVAFTISPNTSSSIISIMLTHVVQERDWPQNPEVELFEVHSKLLSTFRHQDVTLRAGVVVPIDYDASRHYPALYEIMGFSGDHLSAHWLPETRKRLKVTNPLRELYRNAFVILPDPQGPNGHTLLANSEVNGPCADAFITELIPALEAKYPLIAKPSARLLKGHSSGGWTSIWLTTQYPQIFGACWAYAPDPVDFHHFENINLYDEDNAYFRNGSLIPSFHLYDKITCSVRDENREEQVVGPDNSSALQWDSWQAVFGHRNTAGNPAPLFDPSSGKVNRGEAEFYKNKDIVNLLRRDPQKYLPIFRQRVHVLVGEFDSYYLADATESLRDTLQKLSPNSAGDGYVRVIPRVDHRGVLSTPEEGAHPQEMLSFLRSNHVIATAAP